MRLTLDAVLVLDAIDRAGSFAGAAEQLFRVPSAVSYTIHKLEQDLGVRIFDRSGHRAKLTNAGVELLKDGRLLLQLAEEIEQKTRQVNAGWEDRLSIAVGDVVPRGAIYRLLSAFYDTPAHESTFLHVTTETQATCWETLLAGRSDLVIGAPEPGPNVNGYRSQSLGEVQLALVVPSSHPLASAQNPLTSDVCSRYRVVRHVAWPLGTRPDQGAGDVVIVDDYESQVDAIRNGLGIGYVPAYLVREDVNAGRLVTKTVTDAPKLRVAAAWRTDRAGRGLQWFLDRLGDRELRARLVPQRGDASTAI